MKRTFGILFAIFITCFAKGKIVAGKTYVIIPKRNADKSLLVRNSSLEDKADIVVWTNIKVPSQQWEAVASDNGTFLFRNVYTGKLLGRKTGNNTTTAAQITDESSAQWTLIPVKGADNQYMLSPASKDIFLTAVDETDGSLPMMEARKTGSDKNLQCWKFVETEPKKSLSASDRDLMLKEWTEQFVRQRSTGAITYGDGGGWGDAEMMETFLDAYETTGNKECLRLFTEAFSYFKKNVGDDWLRLVYTDNYKWYGHDFNDDVMWMIIASVRAFHLTGTKNYLFLAKKNFDAIYERAYNKWGMLRWAESSGDKNGTNSCINGPAEVAACYIAQASGDSSYYEKARKLYENQRRYLFNASTGQVYDSFVWNESTDKPGKYNHWASTYNQGTMLGAALLLYDYYHDSRYRQDAVRIMDYTQKNLCDANGIVKVCQTPEGDLCGFKGILMRYARRFACTMQDCSVAEWLRKNALHAYCNQNSKHIVCSAWLTKSAEDFKFEGKDFSNQPFGCSTVLSVLFNAPLTSQDRGFETFHFAE